MDYLRYHFDNELNEEGEVIIAGYPFFRDVILRVLDPTAYDDAFSDWCNQKAEEKCAKADEILSCYDNKGRFFRLKELYEKNSVIPFIGAGMSIPSGYPGWTNFLKKICKETRIEEKNLQILIDNGEYEEAAELIYDSLPEGAFLEQIENHFSIEHSINGCIQKIPSIFNNSVITTNFDNVLERVYLSDGPNRFDEILLGGDSSDLFKILGEGKRALVKIHGKSTKSRSRILTKSEYDYHYNESGILESVIEAISNQTLLFIGCSLSNDRTLACLKKIAQRKGIENIPRHYAFLKLDEPENRLDRRDELVECNIHPIWYTEDHDECLDALLEKLADKRSYD